ncbi:MAG: CotH kinase family protein [Planctomycetes bacterium]|nr:CotH kinase family protein [Planctomycetota bacterium]
MFLRLGLLAALCLPPLTAQKAPTPERDPAREFFARGEVVHVRLRLRPEERQKLRDKPREYAAADLRIDDAVFPNVGVKLKGAAGSFRAIDERPGFTVHLGKFDGAERFHGLARFHLNNGAQDDSRLCEWLGHEVFTAAGHPAPRVAHARVWLDDQDQGLYVLRESFDKQFLVRVFGSDAGNLYDGGFCQDVDTDLEKDSGKGPDDHADLHTLRDLCSGVDRERGDALAAAIDVPTFVDFVALESMLGHWDGYSRNMNNFRLWLPTGGKAVFLPHGMDQLLGDTDYSVLDHPPAIVASAVLQVPAFRKRYRDRLKALLPHVQPARLVPKLEAMAAKLQKELRTVGDDAVQAHAEAVRSLVDRVRARADNLDKQSKAPEPKPLQLAVGKAMALKNWNTAAETGGVELAKKGFQGVSALHVQCQPGEDGERVAAWRTHVLLGKGRYQLRGTARCDKLVPTPKDGDGNEHGGVRLRVDGAISERLTGDRNWTALVCDFEVGEFQRNVELACELKALGGQGWFRFDSLSLVRLPD